LTKLQLKTVLTGHNCQYCLKTRRLNGGRGRLLFCQLCLQIRDTALEGFDSGHVGWRSSRALWTLFALFSFGPAWARCSRRPRGSHLACGTRDGRSRLQFLDFQTYLADVGGKCVESLSRLWGLLPRLGRRFFLLDCF
jgi:hypothetical protein